MEEKLQQLKIMLGIDGTDEDELLSLLLTQASDRIVGAVYPYKDTSDVGLPPRYGFLQLEVAERMYNLRGAEGEKEHIEKFIVLMKASRTSSETTLWPFAAFLR